MKANLKTLALATCLAIGTCAYAQEGFIRPELSYDFAKISITGATGIDLKDAVGYGVAGGAFFGVQNEHELGLSVSVTDFRLTSSITGTNITGKTRIVPILANYRYYFGAKADSMRFYLAPSLGFTSSRGDAAIINGNTLTRASSSGNDSTWGAGFGVLFKVADKIDVDAGYRYMEFKESNAKIKMNSLYLGVDARF